MPKLNIVVIIASLFLLGGCAGIVNQKESIPGSYIHTKSSASTAIAYYLGRVQVGDTIAVYPYYKTGSLGLPFLYRVGSKPNLQDPDLAFQAVDKEGVRQVLSLSSLRGYVLTDMGVSFFPQR